MRIRESQLTIAIAAVLTVLVVVCWWCWRQPRRELAPLFVAVVHTTAEQEGIPGEEGELIAGVVSLAVLNTFAGLEQVYALDSVDVGELADLPPRDLARAVAADEVLRCELHGSGPGQMLVLTRHTAAGRLRWRVRIELPADDMPSAVTAVTRSLRQGYGERPRRRGAAGLTASHEDYLTLLSVRRDLSRQRYLNLDQALQVLRDLRKRSPALIEASMLEALVACYRFRTTRQHRYLDRARQVVAEARSQAPDDPRTWRAAVDIALASDDLDGAAAAITELHRRAPLLPRLPRYEAHLEVAIGRMDRAIAVMEAAARERPGWPNLRVLADMEMRCGRIEGARRHLEAALVLAPDHPAVLDKLGELELRSGDLHRAQEIFLGLVADHQLPKPTYLINLGTADMLLGDYAEALVSYRQAEAFGVQTPILLLSMADLHLLSGEVREAAECYERVITAIPMSERSSGEERAMLAYCLARCGRIDQALAALAAAAEQAPDSADIAYYGSLVHLVIGDRSHACAMANRARRAGMSKHWFDLPWFDELRSCIAAPQPSSPDKEGIREGTREGKEVP